MEMIVNKPPAETFGWLQAGAKRIDLQDEIENIHYTLGPGETKTLYIEDPGAAQYDIELGKGSRLDLIQLRKNPEKELTYNDIRVRCGEKAYFGWYRLVLDGAESYDNCSVILQGTESSFGAHIAYRLDGGEKYDLNCVAIHVGKSTESEISAYGVLDDRASKLMRGTIDFRTGCSGSVGNESEDVLLLNEDVRNQSIPVILCGEEDVSGSHGASIGRPDENLLFYMETRGVDKETACEMLARAKIDTVISRIPDEEVRNDLQSKICFEGSTELINKTGERS